MIKYADRVLETSVTQGTGTINLAGPTAGGQSFVDGVGSGAKVAYFIEDGTDWESGIGTVTSGTPDTLSRDNVLESSNADALVDWGPGTRNVFCGASSHMMLWRDENKNDVNHTGTSGGTANAHTLTMTPAPVALSDKMIVSWVAPLDNTNSITLNVNGLGARSYVNNDGTAFPTGFIKAGTTQFAAYNLASTRWERLSQLTPLIDEDNMASDSAVKVPSQQSVKAYVDGKAATQSDQETGTSTTTYVPPGRQHYHKSAAKAWATLNASSGTPVISEQYNISSITDNAVGDFTFNFTTAFSNATYAAISMSGDNNAGTATAAGTNMKLIAAGSCRIQYPRYDSVTRIDYPYISAVFFGDQ